MPVHLGSMGESIKDGAQPATPARCGPATSTCSTTRTTAARTCPTSPSSRRSSTPGEAAEEPQLLFFVASRGHHADIGGITPGSMPPVSRTSRRRASCSTTCCWCATASCASARPATCSPPAAYPVAQRRRRTSPTCGHRSPPTRRASQELRRMVEQFGLDVVRRLHGTRAGQRRGVGAARHRGADTTASFRYETDNGAVIHVALTVDRAARSAVLDFTGTSPQQPGQLQRPRSVVMAAVLYVFRTLVDDDIPLNGGCLKPLSVIASRRARCCAPVFPAAAVAGNVETSQCVTDALYGALGVHGGGLGHDEQLHLRQRPRTSTTRRSPAARARATASTAPTPCRRT